MRRVWLLLLVVALSVDATGRPSAQAPHRNRLATQTSPYLLLHAGDPVDWYPWGPEAFDKARREGKPIFLSIGYSTCHWCHVMRDESFSNPAIAALMNRDFVSIKVDREERPDIDRVYMAYIQSVAGGGWPASVFLTPDLQPFFGATYLPPEDRGGQVGFRRTLEGLSQMWATDRANVLEAAKSGSQVIAAMSQAGGKASAPAGVKVLEATYAALRSSYDATHGGFGGAPKFPRPVVLNFLLRHHARTGARPALAATVGTLRAMAHGGIRDHIGGGFHRYTTDADWHVPHFEKMLYDQAQLAVAYVDAYQVTKEPLLREVARETLDYTLRDMRSPEGGFFSAEDADSLAPPVDGAAARRKEGAFYLWTDREVRARLEPGVAEVVTYVYDIRPDGNVPAAFDIEGHLAGGNVLHLRHSVAETAAHFRLTPREVQTRLARGRVALREARAARPRPALDDKVLVSWNGMMMSALARAAQVFDEPRYLTAARDVARFIESTLYNPKTGRLTRRFRAGRAEIDGVLEDYAFLIQGLLDLYEASFDPRWIAWAIRLQTEQDRLFLDAKAGGYFSTTADAPDLVARFKDDYDGPEPSANSVSSMNLLRLWQLTDRRAWRDRADRLFGALAGRPSLTGLPQLAVALDFSLSKPRQIVIAGRPGAADTRALLKLVHARFMPGKILLLADGGAWQKQLSGWLPTLEGMHPLAGRAAIYVCENYVCRLPTSDLAVAAALLDGKAVSPVP